VERLVIPLGTTRDLARIGAWTEACCAECSISGQAAYHVQLAVDEACANIFEHGYEGQPGPVQLEATGTDEALTLWIRDWGHSFDPNSISKPNPATPIEERAIGGLGIYMMHQVMDEVSYHFDVGNGNRLKLVKRRNT
jgi:serine/threonine-protein kinase RsbW